MAEEVAAQAPAAEDAPMESQDASQPIKYDESLLIMVKGKVQQPKQPEHAESRLLISKLQAEISKRADRIKEIKAIEEQIRGKAQGVASGNSEVIKELQGLRSKRAAILKTKAEIREELRSTDSTREALRAELRTIRDKSRNVNPEKLEEEITQLEFRVQHESLSEQEEKRVHQQIQNLTAARPLARKFVEYDARLKETEMARTGITKRLAEYDSQIKVLDDAISVQNRILDDAKSKADGHREDLPTLQVEKKESYEICVALRAKIDELRKANDEEYQAFIKRDRAFRGYQREQKRLKYLERVKERETRDAERNEQEQTSVAEMGAEPLQGEILTCDQMILYLRGLAGVKEEEGVKKEEKTVEIPAGLKPMKKKNDDMDDIFAGLGKKVKMQGKGKAAAPAPSKSSEPPKAKVTKLNFTLETLKTFMTLGVEVPQTSDGLLATIEKVEAKKAAYLVKREAKKAGKLVEKEVEEVGVEEKEVEKEKASEAEPEAPAPAAAEPEAHAPAAAAAAATAEDSEEKAKTNGKHGEEAASTSGAAAEAAAAEVDEEAAAAAPAEESGSSAAAAADASGGEGGDAPAEDKKEKKEAEAAAAAAPPPAAEEAAALVAAAEAKEEAVVAEKAVPEAAAVDAVGVSLKVSADNDERVSLSISS